MNIILVIFGFSWIFPEKIRMLLQSTSLWSFVLSPEYLLTKNMDNASSWTSFRSFLRSPEYLLKKIWILLQSTSFRSFLLSLEYFLTKNMNGALLNIIPVIFAFSWIFSDKKKYGRCFTERHSGHFCFLLNVFWQKYGQCFTELYSGHFCGLNISHWHCLNQVNFCIFLRKI